MVHIPDSHSSFLVSPVYFLCLSLVVEVSLWYALYLFAHCKSGERSWRKAGCVR